MNNCRGVGRKEVVTRGRRLAARLTAAASLILLVRCVPAPVPPTGTPVPPLNEQALLARLQANAAAFSSLRGTTRLRTESQDGSASARQVLLLAKPDRLRAEVLSPFGQPLLVLAAADGRLQVLLPREQRFLQGEATAESIARFTRLPLSAADLVKLALYDVPLIAYVDSHLTPQGAGYRLTLAGRADRSQVLDFDADGRLHRSEYRQGEELLLAVDYAGFEGDGFPKLVAVAMPAQQAAFTLNYTEIELNPALARDRFFLQPPAGVMTEALP